MVVDIGVLRMYCHVCVVVHLVVVLLAHAICMCACGELKEQIMYTKCTCVCLCVGRSGVGLESWDVLLLLLLFSKKAPTHRTCAARSWDGMR